MRDLEQRIAAWRRSITKASSHRAELVQELEEHLREEIDCLRRSGAAEKDAFEMALAKLGSPAVIASECDKLSLPQRAWWPVNVARWCAAAAVLVSGTLLIFRLDRIGLLLAAHVWCVIIGYLLMFAIGGLGVCHIAAAWFGSPGPTQRHSVLRAMFRFANTSALLTIVAVILGMVWARENLGRYWAWDPKETGAAAVIFSSVLLSVLHRCRINSTTLAFIGVMGSAITAAAWFGVNSKAASGTVSPLAIAFIAMHLLFLVCVPIVSLLKRDACFRKSR